MLVVPTVLSAAALHAGWNAILRGGENRLWSMTLMMVSIAVISIAMVGLRPLSPALTTTSAWPYIAASAFVHVLYNLTLVRSYRSSDLGEAYPIARGSSPALVAIGAWFIAGEHLSLLPIAGVLLVSGGILALSRFRFASAAPALLTGALIGAYTVIDGIGVRIAGDGLAYMSAMFVLWSLTSLTLFFAMGRRPSAYNARQITASLAGGAISYLAYGIVIIALKYAPMAVVSALRETSVLFATLIGGLFLGEKLTVARLAASGAIAAGAACLAWQIA